MAELYDDEIVEALAKRHYDAMVAADKYPENWVSWERLAESERPVNETLRGSILSGARADLKAAAPLIAARALEEAADAFDLDVASARFIASDGVPSVGINTNDEARKLVTDWLRARAKEGRG